MAKIHGMACVRESKIRLCVAGRRVKKFSGLQIQIWKKLFTWKVHPHG
jgi:hypothetical protein